jgi:hypothetical protein
MRTMVEAMPEWPVAPDDTTERTAANIERELTGSNSLRERWPHVSPQTLATRAAKEGKRAHHEHGGGTLRAVA